MNDKDKKIVIMVFTRSLIKGGGISNWIVEYYSRLYRMGFFKIILVLESGEIDYDEASLPFKIIKMTHAKKNPIKSIFEYQRIISKNKNVAWYHFHQDNLVNFVPFVFLRDHQKNVIIQSHNSSNHSVQKSKLKRFLHGIGKKIVKKNHFIHFAVSKEAAKWLFDDGEYTQINNGIDLKKFRFNFQKRLDVLDELNLNNKNIYGHVGRFDEQKNHLKLLSIFKRICMKDVNARLILIGDGPLKKDIQNKILELGLEKVVKILGVRGDVPRLLNAIDYMVFPSLYEGLPLSLVEAQANGVQVYYSNKITSQIDLIPSTKSFDIASTSENISEMIISQNRNLEREHCYNLVKKMGYDREDVVKALSDFYRYGKFDE